MLFLFKFTSDSAWVAKSIGNRKSKNGISLDPDKVSAYWTKIEDRSQVLNLSLFGKTTKTFPISILFEGFEMQTKLLIKTNKLKL